jgi:hypothetical protein
MRRRVKHSRNSTTHCFGSGSSVALTATVTTKQNKAGGGNVIGLFSFRIAPEFVAVGVGSDSVNFT